ncbi:MAG: hypothetical protein HPY54_13610 [Chthonomonadetes bacterium]|nr:hypothetical protein [Chthonomonadetes bacterium]
MSIPEAWQRLEFEQWNQLVKALVAVWDFAERMGAEECLSWHLSMDTDGRLANLLACAICRGAELPYLVPIWIESRAGSNQHNGQPEAEREVTAYFQSTYDGLQPDMKAYRGARMVRELLLQVEQFAEERCLCARDVRRILAEVINVYSDSEDAFPILPSLTS